LDGVSVADLAAMVGDPGRAEMLIALLDGRSMTATELAAVARVAASTASEHLARLTEGGLLRRSASGRHRYFRLASREIAAMLENMLVVAGHASVRPRSAPRCDPLLRDARTCYDH